MNNKIKINNKVLTIGLILALVVITMGAALANQTSLVANIDGNIQEYKTGASTVGEFLDNEGIALEERSYINYEKDQALEEGMEIIVRNPIEVTVLDGGVEKTIKSAHKTVENILGEYQISLENQDYTIPSVKDEIQVSENKKPLIVINRVHSEEIITHEPIPFGQITEENPDMPKGQEKIITQGQDGIMEIKSEKLIVNGHEADTRVLSQVVSQDPISEVKHIGTKEPEVQAAAQGQSAQASSSLEGKNVLRTITMEASAYDPSPASNGKWAGITALGTKLRPGVVAVDPSVIPLGTKLYIESTDSWPDYGMATAEDTGGAIKGNKIDLLFMDRSTCYDFGRRTVKVHVLGN